MFRQVEYFKAKADYNLNENREAVGCCFPSLPPTLFFKEFEENIKKEFQSPQTMSTPAFLTVSSNDRPLGRLSLILRGDVVPRTVENFKQLLERDGEGKTTSGQQVVLSPSIFSLSL